MLKAATCEIGKSESRSLPLMIRFGLEQFKGSLALFEVYLRVLL